MRTCEEIMIEYTAAVDEWWKHNDLQYRLKDELNAAQKADTRKLQNRMRKFVRAYGGKGWVEAGVKLWNFIDHSKRPCTASVQGGGDMMWMGGPERPMTIKIDFKFNPAHADAMMAILKRIVEAVESPTD